MTARRPIAEIAQVTGLQETLGQRCLNVRDAAFGAVGGCVVDDTDAIAAALAAAGAGGIVYLPPGGYLVTSTLSLGENSYGVRLLGAADGFASGGSYIKWTGTGPCISVPGCYGFEIGNLSIWGNEDGEDGIELINDDANIPRSGSIHDVSLYQLTGDALRLSAYAYVSVRDIFANVGARGIVVPETAGLLREFLRTERATVHSMTGAGFDISGGLYNDFRQLNAAYCDVGVKLQAADANGLYHQFFDSVAIDHSTSYGLEIDAAAGYVTRVMLRGINVFMLGADADEKAVYVHRTNGFNAGPQIDYLNIDREGAVAPTNSIDLSGAFQGSVGRVRDASGGAHVDGAWVAWEGPVSAPSAPASGYHLAGERVYNSSPASSGYVGWVCTVAGTPGTWLGFGTIA